jgi:hypothetical protein
MSRFNPKAAELLRSSVTTLCAKRKPEEVQQHARAKLRLLDHLIGANKKRIRDGEIE